jgi:hypothetical protein
MWLRESMTLSGVVGFKFKVLSLDQQGTLVMMDLTTERGTHVVADQHGATDHAPCDGPVRHRGVVGLLAARTRRPTSSLISRRPRNSDSVQPCVQNHRG